MSAGREFHVCGDFYFQFVQQTVGVELTIFPSHMQNLVKVDKDKEFWTYLSDN